MNENENGNEVVELEHIWKVSQGTSVMRRDSSAMKQTNAALCHISCENKTLDELGYEEFTYDLVGKIATFLVHHATKYQKIGGCMLSGLTIMNYMSSLKMFVLNKFREQPTRPCFEEGRWKKTLRHCQIEKSNLNRINGIPNQENTDYATDKEHKLLAVACMWANDKKFANFFLLNKVLYHLVARCCEGAQQRKSTISIAYNEEEYVTYPVVSFDVERYKTHTTQKLQVFPHRSSFLMDIYFAMAYYLVLDNGEDDAFFPAFYGKISKSGSNKIDSKTSNMFNEYYKVRLSCVYFHQFSFF